MVRRLALFAVWLALLCCFHERPCFALEGAEEPDGVVWTAIIPDAFPRYVYTWRLRSDGTYREDGRDAVKGTAIQETLSGRWTTDGARMILRQQGQTFVFDGVVLGGIYAGTLYFNGRVVSRFCAARGETPPDQCSTGPVATTGSRTPAHFARMAAAGSRARFFDT
jgi:hypothetical protein